MINVIDRIQYLPKGNDPILDINDITNKAYKMVVENVKNRVRFVSTNGKRATVTVTGRVQRNQTKTDFSVSIECEDEDVKAAIAKAVRK